MVESLTVGTMHLFAICTSLISVASVICPGSTRTQEFRAADLVGKLGAGHSRLKFPSDVLSKADCCSLVRVFVCAGAAQKTMDDVKTQQEKMESKLQLLIKHFDNF